MQRNHPIRGAAVLVVAHLSAIKIKISVGLIADFSSECHISRNLPVESSAGPNLAVCQDRVVKLRDPICVPKIVIYAVVGTIKCAELEKENGMLIWSVDVAQPGKKDLTDVWVDATTGKITAVEVETPAVEKKEVAEHKAQKWLSRNNPH